METASGALFTFDISSVEVGSELLPGQPITLEFYGELNYAAKTQKLQVYALSSQTALELAIDSKLKMLLQSMTLEEKVGQLFIARYPKENKLEDIKSYKLGGYIWFGRDFEGKTPLEVSGEVSDCQAASALPMLMGVDEEGGTVNRISLNPALRSSPFLSPQQLYTQGGYDAIESDAREKSVLLKSLGMNLNFAPVCDLPESSDDFIYARSFGTSAAETSEYISLVVETMKEEGMGSVLKHFPGYGSNIDTHGGMAKDSRPYQSFVERDFLPFQAGIAAGADLVLVNHNIVESMDAVNPASLSTEVHKVLREKLGFDGVIVTDDLSMGAIREFADIQQSSVLAIQSGNDLVCCTDYQVQIPAVLEAVKDGRIPQSRIDESVLRILKLKHNLGLLF